MIFRDRSDAGCQLARALEILRDREDVLVLAIPRGGVVIGLEIAREFRAPLDLWIAHKISPPGNPEFAIGSVVAGGEVFLDNAAVRATGVSSEYLDEEIFLQRKEVDRRMREYRGSRPPLPLAEKIVLLVDDGLATGSTALSALNGIRRFGPKKIILAAPVASPEAAARCREAADETVLLATPDYFRAVGQFYESFDQVTDREVIALLEEARNFSPQ